MWTSGVWRFHYCLLWLPVDLALWTSNRLRTRLFWALVPAKGRALCKLGLLWVSWLTSMRGIIDEGLNLKCAKPRGYMNRDNVSKCCAARVIRFLCSIIHPPCCFWSFQQRDFTRDLGPKMAKFHQETEEDLWCYCLYNRYMFFRNYRNISLVSVMFFNHASSNWYIYQLFDGLPWDFVHTLLVPRG